MNGKLIGVLTPVGFDVDFVADNLRDSLQHQGFSVAWMAASGDYNEVAHLMDQDQLANEAIYDGILDWAKKARKRTKMLIDLAQEHQYVIASNLVCPYLFLTRADPKRSELIEVLSRSHLYEPCFLHADYSFAEFNMNLLSPTNDGDRRLAMMEFQKSRYYEILRNSGHDEKSRYWKDASEGYWGDHGWRGQWEFHSHLANWAGYKPGRKEQNFLMEINAENLLQGTDYDPKKFMAATAEMILFNMDETLKQADMTKLRLSSYFSEVYNWVMASGRMEERNKPIHTGVRYN